MNVDSLFAGCTSLTDLYCYAPNVPENGKDIFANSNIANATLHVPAAYLDIYKNADQWKDFGKIVAIEQATSQAGEMSWNVGKTVGDDKRETYTIAANGKHYGTICLPYDCTVENAYIFKPYQLTHDNSGNVKSLKFETRGTDFSDAETKKLEAGMPYFFARIDDAEAVVFTKTGDAAGDVKAKTLSNGFTGTYTDITVSEGSYMLATVNGIQKFYQAGANSTCKAFRAYVQNLTDLPTEATSARGKVITLGEDELTGILDINGENAENTLSNGKFIRNNSIVIVKDGVMYNTCGERIR